MKNRRILYEPHLAMIFLLFLLAGMSGAIGDQQVSDAQEPSPAQVTTSVVTSIADSGPGSLRQALRDAQAGDTIIFDPAIFPPAAPATIYLNAEDSDSALPNVTRGGLTIDASNAGVILDGSAIEGDWVNGLEVYSDGNVIRGLQIVNFSGSGIAICSAFHNTIGGDRGIGAGPLGQGNLSSRNGIGIDLCDSGFLNTISGNIIGTDPVHTQDWGNRMDGIWIENGMIYNTIGPDNIIAYNDWNGIRITGPNAFGNVMTRNSIHDNSFGIRLQDGGNLLLSAPDIVDFDSAVGSVTGTACANCIIEVFSDTSNEGEVYEGQTKANSLGKFTLDKGTSFTGPFLTATATDADGNTSEFSLPTYALLQEGNSLPRFRIQPKESVELSENYIGRHWHGLALAPDLWWMLDDTLEVGLKRFRLSINSIDSDKIDWDLSESYVDPVYDEFISRLADNGITMTFVLSFWDKEYVAAGGEIPSPRFKTEDEIQRYLEFVRFIVSHFKDRIQYYEIWNEPNITHMELQWIEVADYLNLVRRAVPVIRQEYPAARIVVGSTSGLRDPGSRDYLFSILNSDTISLVDALSWHPFSGESPEFEDLRLYYYEYPSTVQAIKDTASAHGFEGEYIGDEISWRTHDNPDPDHPWTYSMSAAAKYYLRGIMLHLGMEARVSQHAIDPSMTAWPAVRNLCTVMAGAESADLPFTLQSAATNVVSYTFSLSNGNSQIALWTDGIAVDDDYGIPSTLTIPGLTEHTAVGIDVLHGVQQQLVTSERNGNMVISDLLVKDYPIILRVAPVRRVFLPVVSKE